MSTRLRQSLIRFLESLRSQSRAVLKSCLGLTAQEQAAIIVVLSIVLLGFATRFAVRVLGWQL